MYYYSTIMRATEDKNRRKNDDGPGLAGFAIVALLAAFVFGAAGIDSGIAGEWPLLNLILMFSGVVLGLFTVILRTSTKDRDGDRKFMNLNVEYYNIRDFSDRADAAREYTLSEYRDLRGIPGEFNATSEMRRRIINMAIRIIAAGAAVSGAVLWFITEEIAGHMVLTDMYTIPQAVLAAIAIACFVIFIVREGD
jgi:hypothetical protein